MRKTLLSVLVFAAPAVAQPDFPIINDPAPSRAGSRADMYDALAKALTSDSVVRQQEFIFGGPPVIARPETENLGSWQKSLVENYAAWGDRFIREQALKQALGQANRP